MESVYNDNSAIIILENIYNIIIAGSCAGILSFFKISSLKIVLII
jgi:hypothetical protein